MGHDLLRIASVLGGRVEAYRVLTHLIGFRVVFLVLRYFAAAIFNFENKVYNCL